MPASPSAAAPSIRWSAAVLTAISWGMVTPIALAVHSVAANATTAGDHHEDGLVVLFVAVLSLVVLGPVAFTTAVVLFRQIPHWATVGVTAASLVQLFLACLTPGWVWPVAAVLVVAGTRWALPRLRWSDDSILTQADSDRRRAEAAERAGQPGPPEAKHAAGPSGYGR